MQLVKKYTSTPGKCVKKTGKNQVNKDKNNNSIIRKYIRSRFSERSICIMFTKEGHTLKGQVKS